MNNEIFVSLLATSINDAAALIAPGKIKAARDAFNGAVKASDAFKKRQEILADAIRQVLTDDKGNIVQVTVPQLAGLLAIEGMVKTAGLKKGEDDAAIAKARNNSMILRRALDSIGGLNKKQGAPRKGKETGEDGGEGDGEATTAAKDDKPVVSVASLDDAQRFAVFVQLVEGASRATLQRMANMLAVTLAGSKDGTTAADAAEEMKAAQPVKTPARKRASK